MTLTGEDYCPIYKKYDSNFGAIEFSKNGNKLSGTYTENGRVGTLAGTLKGNVLEGVWKDGASGGPLVMTFSYDGSSFVIKWRFENKTEWHENWTGKKTN